MRSWIRIVSSWEAVLEVPPEHGKERVSKGFPPMLRGMHEGEGLVGMVAWVGACLVGPGWDLLPGFFPRMVGVPGSLQKFGHGSPSRVCVGGGGRVQFPRSPNPPPQGCPAWPKISLEASPLIVDLGCGGGGSEILPGVTLYRLVGGGSPSFRRLRPLLWQTPPTSPTPRFSAPAKVSAPANAEKSECYWPP